MTIIRGGGKHSITQSPSASSFCTDLDGHPSHSVGHMLGSSHVEQMYSDLGSDWRKELRKKGGADDVLGVGVG